MARDGRRHGVKFRGQDDDKGLVATPLPDDLREALVPLVRLLARQAARDWVEKNLDGAPTTVNEGEPPEED
jgi:hypothetical protein